MEIRQITPSPTYSLVPVPEIPKELGIRILGFLNLAAFTRSRLVCRTWCVLTSDPTCWQNSVRKENGSIRNVESVEEFILFLKEKIVSWKVPIPHFIQLILDKENSEVELKEYHLLNRFILLRNRQKLIELFAATEENDLLLPIDTRQNLERVESYISNNAREIPLNIYDVRAEVKHIYDLDLKIIIRKNEILLRAASVECNSSEKAALYDRPQTNFGCVHATYNNCASILLNKCESI